MLLDEEINTQWTDAAEDFKSLPSGNDLKESKAKFRYGLLET